MNDQGQGGLRNRPSVQLVSMALERAGCSDDRIIELAETARTAEDAANALNCEMGAIIKSLVFRAGDQPVLALVSGDRLCDPKALKAELGLERKIRRADAEFVKAATGFSIGGVSPLGHPSPITTVVDQYLSRYSTLYAAAGHTHCVFSTNFEEIVQLTQGLVSESISMKPSVN